MTGPSGLSCGPFVLVDQPAEHLATMYPGRRKVGDQGRDAVVAVWWPQVPGPVRAMLVIVRGVLVEDRPQVPRPGDQHPVGDLDPGGAHPPLGIGIRSRAARRYLHYLDPSTGQHSVERLGELPGPVADQEPEARGARSSKSIS